MSYWQMKRRVERYKTLVGKKAKEVPDELITLEMQVNRMSAEIQAMKDRKEPEGIIATKAVDLGVLKIRYKTAIKKYESQQ